MTVLSLHPWMDPGWLPENFGYYIHHGYVYTTGQILSNSEEEGGSKPTRTICRGLPRVLRPKVATKIILPTGFVGTDFPANPLLNPKQEYASTIFPNGIWTLDFLPSYFTTTPTAFSYTEVAEGEEYPTRSQYSNPLFLALITGNARWQIAASVDEYKLLEGELREAFTGSAKYVKHLNRTHLGGTITRVADDEGGQNEIFAPPPVSDSAVRLIDKFTTLDWTWALGPGGRRVPLRVSSARLAEEGDKLKPAGESPPLVGKSGFGKMHKLGGVGSLGGPDLAPNWLTPGADPTAAPAGAWGLCKYTKTKRTLNTYECSDGFSTTICTSVTNVPTVICFPSAVLATCWPPPPWFMLIMLPQIDEFDKAITEGHVGCNPAHPTACEPWHVSWHETGGTWPVVPGYEVLQPEASYEKWPEGNSDLYTVVKPPASHYIGDPLISTVAPFGRGGLGEEQPTVSAAPYIWRHDQCPGQMVVEWPGMKANRATMAVEFRIVPYWEGRQWGLHAGDELDLSPTGYPAPYKTRGHVDIGAVTDAVVARDEEG